MRLRLLTFRIGRGYTPLTYVKISAKTLQFSYQNPILSGFRGAGRGEVFREQQTVSNKKLETWKKPADWPANSANTVAPPKLDLGFTFLSSSSSSSNIDPTAAELVNDMINMMEAAAQACPSSFSPHIFPTNGPIRHHLRPFQPPTFLLTGGPGAEQPEETGAEKTTSASAAHGAPEEVRRSFWPAASDFTAVAPRRRDH